MDSIVRVSKNVLLVMWLTLVSRIASLTTWHKRLRHRASDLNVKEIMMQKLRSEHPQADIFDWTKEEKNF